jgi:hypothetical protein
MLWSELFSVIVGEREGWVGAVETYLSPTEESVCLSAEEISDKAEYDYLHCVNFVICYQT